MWSFTEDSVLSCCVFAHTTRLCLFFFLTDIDAQFAAACNTTSRNIIHYYMQTICRTPIQGCRYDFVIIPMCDCDKAISLHYDTVIDVPNCACDGDGTIVYVLTWSSHTKWQMKLKFYQLLSLFVVAVNLLKSIRHA